jgi:pimeloyl-ACP methyl ester carboxylesterase
MLEALLAMPYADFEAAPPEERARAARVMQRILPVSSRAAGLENDARICSTLPRYELENITAPTLVVTTENDLFRTLPGSRYTAEHVPGARLVTFPTGGHLWLGHGAEVSRLVGDFLGELASSPPAPGKRSEERESRADLIRSDQALTGRR